MNRRNFITRTAMVGSITAINGNNPLLGSSFQQDKDLIIEWNAHLFSSDTEKYPFHPKATYQPDPSRFSEDPLTDYLNYLNRLGIDRAVVVHPEPYGDDHSLILDAMKASPDRLKGTSLFYPKDTAAPRKLASLVKTNPDIVSTRFHAHLGKESYLDSFDDSGARALWKQAVELDLIIELHIGPNYAQSAIRAIKAFPGCKVLIDHLAEPHLGNAVEFADILRMADFPNVYMKFSGLAHFAKDAPKFLSARTFTSQVIKAFGPDRIVMGGVEPATVDLHMQEYSEKDRAKVKGNNLRDLLSWS